MTVKELETIIAMTIDAKKWCTIARNLGAHSCDTRIEVLADTVLMYKVMLNYQKRIEKAGLKSQVTSCIHDSVTFECTPGETFEQVYAVTRPTPMEQEIINTRIKMLQQGVSKHGD